MFAGFVACNEALSPDPASLGYDYFPLNTGDTRIYDVERINYNNDLTSDTSYYQLMEVIGTTFSSASGAESYRVERFVRESELEEWQIDSVWSARRNTYQAIVVENNVPIIKLSFPVEEDRRWNGNAMNTRDYDEFKMVDLGVSKSIAGTQYASTLELVKEDLLAERFSDNYHKEIFASGVGMIYRIDIDRQYCDFNDCPDDIVILFGKAIEYKLIDYQVAE